MIADGEPSRAAGDAPDSRTSQRSANGGAHNRSSDCASPGTNGRSLFTSSKRFARATCQGCHQRDCTNKGQDFFVRFHDLNRASSVPAKTDFETSSFGIVILGRKQKLLSILTTTCYQGSEVKHA